VDPAIRVVELSKQYTVGGPRRYDTFRDLVAARARFRRRGSTMEANRIWALRDVSLEIAPGEIIGIVGRNGAGKSTLLKILSRITVPTKGHAEIRGVVGSLLEVGTGFHPELTGRENVFINGAILGMTQREIRQKFDEIVAFAEVERFIDTPIKRYSSGMSVRLAFSVAAHFEPEVLLVDEVLSVGDQEFQRRCLGRVREISEGGRTVLFVSHNLAAVSSLCTRAFLLERGSVTAEGRVDAVLHRYADSVRQHTTTLLGDRRDRRGNGHLRFTAVTVEGPAGPIHVGDPMTVALDYVAEVECRGVEVALSFHGPLGEPLFRCASRASAPSFDISPGSGTVTCSIPELPLLPANYSINVFAHIGGDALTTTFDILDWVQDATIFEVFESDYFGSGQLPPKSHGYFVVRQAWSLDEGLTSGTSSATVSEAPA